MMPPIISLPVFDRPYLDNSIGQSLDRCSRLAFYNYRLNRAGVGRNYPIEFGNAYHTFRDVLEKTYRQTVIEKGKELDDVAEKLFEYSWGMAVKGWIDPPLEHKKSYLDKTRLASTCREAFTNWLSEKRLGAIIVLSTETPFDLELPGWWRCSAWKYCDFAITDEATFDWAETHCPKCGSPLQRRRFAGKIDQFIEWNKRLWFRDWKTTGMNGDFNKRYNPDHQFTGYSWATGVLSRRRPEGGIIEVIYNIKTKGPDFTPVYAARTKDDIDHWLVWIHDVWAEWEMRVRTDRWPMKTQGCEKYGGCFFRDACNTGSWFAIEGWLKQKTVESSWDPLNPDVEVGLPE